MKPHRGVMILVFGILGIVFCPIFAIMAWLMGKGDMAEIQAGRMDPEGEQLTNIGRILGIVGSIIFMVGFVFLCIIFIVLPIVLGGAAAVGN